MMSLRSVSVKVELSHRSKQNESPLPSREGGRGRGFSRPEPAPDLGKPAWAAGSLGWHSRADARRPLPLSPSRKGRGDKKGARREGGDAASHPFGGHP